ncbi:MAG: hypothetical protein JW915_04185 [Chitinispirillaceae bacterium]|nr:hypothetical protein [Chitinispirillaceae bacterium]
MLGREYYKTHTEQVKQRIKKWRDEDPNRVKAHNVVKWAIKSGKIIRPTICQCCGEYSDRLEAHHHSYQPEYWLDVKFLCVSCHRQLHEDLIKQGKELT